MRIPAISGVIARRILVNYRVDPAALGRLLPPPFRPALVGGRGVAGICLIRLTALRPRAAPAALGLTAENAAHRIAVEWDAAGGIQEGVYIPRRDSASRLLVLVGGRLFPGVHHHARFRVAERHPRYRVELASDDGGTRLAVAGRVAAELPATSLFDSLEEASTFFARGAVGYSPAGRAGRFDGLELRPFAWRVEPLAVEEVASSFFEDRRLFPPGTAEFDCALLMRGIAHEWHARPALRAR